MLRVWGKLRTGRWGETEAENQFPQGLNQQLSLGGVCPACQRAWADPTLSHSLPSLQEAHNLPALFPGVPGRRDRMHLRSKVLAGGLFSGCLLGPEGRVTGLILQNQAQLGLPKAQGPEEDSFHQEHEAIRYQEQQVPCWHPSTSTWAQYHGLALGVWREESSPSVLSTEARGAWDKGKHLPLDTLADGP